MTCIERALQTQILNDETPPKAVIIFGARQVGKTTLLDEREFPAVFYSRR